VSDRLDLKTKNCPVWESFGIAFRSLHQAALLQAKEPLSGAETIKGAALPQDGKENNGKDLQTPFAAPQQQSTLGASLQAAQVSQQTPIAPSGLTAMQNGAAVTQANGSMQPDVLKKLLMANGISEAAAARGMNIGSLLLPAFIL